MGSRNVVQGAGEGRWARRPDLLYDWHSPWRAGKVATHLRVHVHRRDLSHTDGAMRRAAYPGCLAATPGAPAAYWRHPRWGTCGAGPGRKQDGGMTQGFPIIKHPPAAAQV